MATKNRERAVGGTSDLSDHRGLRPGVFECADRDSWLSGSNGGERTEDPLRGLLTGD